MSVNPPASAESDLLCPFDQQTRVVPVKAKAKTPAKKAPARKAAPTVGGATGPPHFAPTATAPGRCSPSLDLLSHLSSL